MSLDLLVKKTDLIKGLPKDPVHHMPQYQKELSICVSPHSANYLS